jgi:fructose-bisphosphate aldolase class II
MFQTLQRILLTRSFLHTHTQPRECMRAGELQTVARLEQSFADLKCQNILGLGEMQEAQNVLGPRRGGLPV